ncbi:MAG: glucose-6-phosphate isomerase [Haloferacaceae archaeon]
MRVDIGNALDGVATPGVPRAALDRLDDRVADAHERIRRGRREGAFGYAALDLPERTDPDAIRRVVGGFEDPEVVLTVGIGGSALGAATVAAALDAPDGPAWCALDNVDPARTASVVDGLPLDRTVVNVVSRSGATAETLANFLVVRDAMARAGVDWAERTVVTTGPEGPLARLADRRGLARLPVPDGAPGRFSVFSPVGLTLAAFRGHDLDALLAGARGAADGLAGSLFETPAYAYGATCYALAQRGAASNAVMPYAEALETFAEWFAQLWAESLGKDGLGQTPIRALGATDQHSQLQLYRAGPRDKLVTLVRPRERPDRPIPAPADGEGGGAGADGADLGGLSYLPGSSLGDLIDAEFRATEASLAAADRPTVRVEVPRVDERSLGALLYGMEAACVLYGELLGVDPFTQPAVEWGKRAARGLLGGGDEAAAAAAEAVDRETTELIVE